MKDNHSTTTAGTVSDNQIGRSVLIKVSGRESCCVGCARIRILQQRISREDLTGFKIPAIAEIDPWLAAPCRSYGNLRAQGCFEWLELRRLQPMCGSRSEDQ